LASFVGIFVWWALSVVLGLIAWPLTYRLFKFLPDRGLGLTRLVGWLVTGYLAWILGFGFNHALTSFIAFGLLALLSWRLYQPRQTEHKTWLAANGNLVFVYEVAFFMLFFIWSLVRMKHSNIEGQEKFMDFAFLNSILRDSRLPPADPWLAAPHNYINYYYFGYFLNASFARLTFLSPDLLYNLAVSNNFALCGVAMLSLGYNLTRAFWPGIAGLLALEVFGNLHGALQVLGIGWRQGFSWWEPTRLIKDVVKDGHYLNGWWWSASDSSLAAAGLTADAAKDGLISEFPAFSFLHGDLHPHFTALPLTLLLLALGLNLVKSTDSAPLSLSARWDERTQGWLAFALVLGSIFMANTWDLPSAGLLAALLLLAQQHAAGQLTGPKWLKQWLLPAALLLPALLVAALLFVLFFHNPADKGFGFHGARTGLHDTLVFWGLFLSVLIPATALRLRHLALGEPSPKGAKKSEASRAVKAAPAAERVCGSCGAKIRPGKAFCSQCGTPYAEPEAPIADAESLSAPAWAQAWLQLLVDPAKAFQHASVRIGLPILMALLLAALVKAPTAFVFLSLALGSALVLAARGASREGLFAAATVLVGSCLVLLCEAVYLKDVFSGNPNLTRMNTVFKFYFQAWILFAAALPFALKAAWDLIKNGSARIAYGVALGLLAIGALVYPAKAIAFVWADWDQWSRLPPSLDGAQWMRRDYPADYSAILKIRDQIDGQPVLAEAVGGAYTHFARVSAYTGLRAVVGWGNHESQWRKDWPQQQEHDVDELFQTLDPNRARQIIQQYGVDYVFVGQLEQQKYAASGGLGKFAQLGQPVVNEGGSILYRINK
jgi:uncharacterized membrane protein